MGNLVIKAVVRSMFFFSSSQRAITQAEGLLDKYTRLAAGLRPEEGRRSVKVPPMPGVDEDMRRWSFYMILEHNTIVNRSISATIDQLIRKAPPSGAACIDVKKDVMPSSSVGEEQVRAFSRSVADHLDMVRGLGGLRNTTARPHVLFGDFNAHQWNCMFAFHLGLHYRQAKHVVRQVKMGAS